ncbi:abortive infection family protein [Acetobacter sp. TBRC 12305]|uniref:Abortive infection family protein n=3 Tax=Acetobacteraceae TaxID=433 RepID=A0A939HNI9_9PROT|nr:abortive infection family protein [Acetobacter garciniae]MBX0344995.1 abortive infection family protein [Acetobacter garciniae]PYD65523.1 hypothetical protein CDI09_13025 [Komagataeibacter nataicola]GBR15447.1 hypothetical protein AA0616_0558 [Komagataeibacter nataicola NRIC 0616]
MNVMEKIPTSIIGLLSQIFPDRYTQAEIDALFLFSGAPEPIPDGSKATKVQAWLRQINSRCNEPLKILGSILDDFLEKQSPGNTFWLNSTDDHVAKLAAEKDRIRETLTREGLTYVRGGNIVKGGAVSTLSLDESVKKYGLKSVDIEIQRALSQIEQDPHAAAQYAGNVLEAVLKAYLDHKRKAYNTTDTLAELWKSAADVIGLRPADWDNKDLKRIASGLYGIVDGIAHLRNAKSSAHGRSEEQFQNITIKPRHARLAIHSAHTVCAYVLELFE